MPSSGCMARSVMTMSIGWPRSTLQRLGAVGGLEDQSFTPMARRISVSSTRMWWLSSTSRIFSSSNRNRDRPSEPGARTRRNVIAVVNNKQLEPAMQRRFHSAPKTSFLIAA